MEGTTYVVYTHRICTPTWVHARIQVGMVQTSCTTGRYSSFQSATLDELLSTRSLHLHATRRVTLSGLGWGAEKRMCSVVIVVIISSKYYHCYYLFLLLSLLPLHAICMYVCMYVCMCVYIYIYVCIYIYIYISIVHIVMKGCRLGGSAVQLRHVDLGHVPARRRGRL